MSEVFYITSVLVVRSAVLPNLWYYVCTNCGTSIYLGDNVPAMVKKFVEKNTSHSVQITPYIVLISCVGIEDLSRA